MQTIDLDKLREVVALAKELERIAEKVTPMLELIQKLDSNAVIPTVNDRFLSRKDVAKILKISGGTVAKLIKRGKLKPLYVADSTSAKFRLSDVQKILVGIQ